MKPGKAVLARFAAGGPIADRVLIVVAHPDDETIGLGAQIQRFNDALLLHVTDGAPRDGEDAGNYGFASVADYAAARQAELAAAMRAGNAARLRRLALGIPDKEAWRDLAGLAQSVAELLGAEQPAAVFTHAYEGGHPDHDAAAFAVHAACRLADAPPAILEMPLYHRRAGRFVTGEFIPSCAPSRRRPGSTSPPSQPLASGLPPSLGPRICSIAITGEALRRKMRMIDCFATQRWLLGRFDLSTERFRVAPDYDFRQPPHPGELHYETLGWSIAGAHWRRAAVEALELLGLEKRCR
jgi:LmbE family N-acetylglucosaminyl deacetylase